jgi:hypothetical protein
MAKFNLETTLLQVVEGQAALSTQVRTMNNRLFGGEGEKGSLPILFEKHDALIKEVTNVKEKINVDIAAFNEKEVKPLGAKVVELAKDTSINLWRVGAVTGVAGSAAGVAVSMSLKSSVILLIKKLFGG